MFFEGSLQDGISTALQQNKLVACFVTDDGEESQKWENEFLNDESLGSRLAADAVVLRLKQGSEEAGFLAAIFPIPQSPTLVVIRNGELKEYIAPGTTQAEFTRRVSVALGVSPDVSAPAQEDPVAMVTTPEPAPQQASQPAEPSTSTSTAATPDPQTPQARTPTPTNSARDTVSHAVRKRMEATQARGKAKGKAKAEPDEADDSPQAQAWRRHQEETKKHSEAIKKKQLEARQERERILKRIEDDKRSRRKREEHLAEEKQRAASESAEAGKEKPDAVQGMTSSLITNKQSSMTALQVRLFDGSTIRTRLPSTATVRAGVRTWVDDAISASGGDNVKAPYTFRIVLAPLPNRAIDATEEDKSLRELGLAPSATLVMVPVGKYASAYESTGGSTSSAAEAAGSALGGVLAAIMGFFTWLFGLVSGVFSGLGSQAPREDAAPSAEEIRARREEGRRRRPNEDTRIRGFQNPDDQRDYQLYNGNSLNFEPRPENEEQ